MRACLPAKGWTIPPAEIAKRLDLREAALVCSVDPPGCVDIDDALHVTALSDGTFQARRAARAESRARVGARWCGCGCRAQSGAAARAASHARAR